MKLTEKAFINKMAIMCHTIIDTVLLVAYTLELIKGTKTAGFFAVFAVLCAVPVIAEWLAYFKNKDSEAIKHIICTTYSVLYLFTIFKTDSGLPFIYAFPMYMVVILYMDIKISILIAGGGFLGNVVFVARHALTVGYGASELADVEIRIAAVTLTGIFMILCCRVVDKVNKMKLVEIQEKGKAASAMADRVLEASSKMIEDISMASEKVVKLGESVVHIHESMNEVSQGSNETAESVQNQMQRTEQIQAYIQRVKGTTEDIEKNLADTAQKVEDGRQQMEALENQVAKSMEANAQVLERMRELSEYTGQMNTIIEAITSIANSTGMLALNASIEAARAGEAGRGFAVVATQISGLANQTKEATVNITSLIENINAELVSVESAIEVVTESNAANSESTKVVTENFAGISAGAENVGEQTKELLDIVSQLESANGDIVEHIQNISAITEEVSAHAGETYEACEENISIVAEVTGIVDSLNVEAEKLREEK